MTNKENTILAIDVGNTNIHWSYIKDGKLTDYKRNKHTELSLLPWDEVKKNNYSVVIAGALIHMNGAVKTIASDHGVKVFEITLDKQNIIKNTYSTLGMDRVCNLIGALRSFSSLNTPVLVFDFGTATTMTASDSKGNFLGGIITTGCETELKAISSKTLSLPHVQLAKEQKITVLDPLANSTEDAILHGTIIGQVGLVEYYLNLFKKKTNSTPKIVFTGGNAPTILKFYKTFDLFDPHLAIKGIFYCYEECFAKRV